MFRDAIRCFSIAGDIQSVSAGGIRCCIHFERYLCVFSEGVCERFVQNSGCGAAHRHRFRPALQAQNTEATVLGTVKDPSGAAVAGATVQLTNQGTNSQRTATTDENGDYRFTRGRNRLLRFN